MSEIQNAAGQITDIKLAEDMAYAIKPSMDEATRISNQMVAASEATIAKEHNNTNEVWLEYMANEVKTRPHAWRQLVAHDGSTAIVGKIADLKMADEGHPNPNMTLIITEKGPSLLSRKQDNSGSDKVFDITDDAWSRWDQAMQDKLINPKRDTNPMGGEPSLEPNIFTFNIPGNDIYHNPKNGLRLSIYPFRGEDLSKLTELYPSVMSSLNAAELHFASQN